MSPSRLVRIDARPLLIHPLLAWEQIVFELHQNVRNAIGNAPDAILKLHPVTFAGQR